MNQDLTYALSKRELKRMIAKDPVKFQKASTMEQILNESGAFISPDDVRKVFRQVGVKYSPVKTIAHLNMRGGIGKTTASINLATRAVQYGFKTCLVDLDPQASATYALFPGMSADHLVAADIWETPAESVAESLVEVSKNLFLLPSSLDNSILDDEWDSPEIQLNAVKGILDILKNNGFDLIVIDAAPSLSSTVISIIASIDHIVVPVYSDPFSVRGLEILLTEAAEIASAFKRQPPEISILFAQYDSRLKLSESVYKSLKKAHPKQLMKSKIRTSTEFSKAIHNQETVFRRNLKHVASIDYDDYVRELLSISVPSPF